jgi:hypothetical protein
MITSLTELDDGILDVRVDVPSVAAARRLNDAATRLTRERAGGDARRRVDPPRRTRGGCESRTTSARTWTRGTKAGAIRPGRTEKVGGTRHAF